MSNAVRAVAVVGMIAALNASASAQNFEPGNLNGGRDCQVVRTCNFARTGAVRGCLSSYTCRTCKLVASRCSIGSAPSNTCQRLSCTWGG
jgi:hypothetical protein